MVLEQIANLSVVNSACGFESHRRHLEIGLWPMPFCGCAVVSPQSASPTAPPRQRGLAAHYVESL